MRKTALKKMHIFQSFKSFKIILLNRFLFIYTENNTIIETIYSQSLGDIDINFSTYSFNIQKYTLNNTNSFKEIRLGVVLDHVYCQDFFFFPFNIFFL